MSFFHKKNVTKCLGHHYAIWTSDSNFLLAPNSGTDMAWVRAWLCKLQKRVHLTRSRK